VHVLPAGQAWVNKQSTASGYIFVAGDKEVPLGAEGTEVVAGWKIESFRRLSRAMVTGAGLEDAAGGPENPAVEVTITDEKGSREQHRAFSNFPDMVMGKPLGGDARSGLKLISRAPDAGGEALFVYGTPPALKVAYIGADGRVQEFESAGGFPWTVQAGPRTITIFNQLTHARAASRLVQAPKGAENRPALLVRLADMSADDAIPLLWRQPTPLPIPVPEGQDPVMVRFGPRLVALPFTIRLTEFRKKDYPGTDMAMSYESDVNVTLGDGSNKPATISMNEPFKGAGWKVYQSGFIGSDVSVFSIMKDPGLPLTYVGCIGLCIGIVLTFYSRPLSTGHPGIPALFGSANGNRRKEQIDVPSVPVCIDDSVVHVPAAGVGAAVPIAAARLEVRPGLDPGAGRRAHHAAGHVCAATGGPAHGTHKLARR
jgi:hypothetical protein